MMDAGPKGETRNLPPNVAGKITGRNTCFSRRHMPPAVSGFYEYARALSRSSGVFFSSAV